MWRIFPSIEQGGAAARSEMALITQIMAWLIPVQEKKIS